jgi:hypothetical protein
MRALAMRGAQNVTASASSAAETPSASNKARRGARSGID